MARKGRVRKAEIFPVGAERPSARQLRSQQRAGIRLREQIRQEKTTERVRAEMGRATRYAKYYREKQAGWVYAKEVTIPPLQPRPFFSPAIIEMIERFPLIITGVMEHV